MRYGRVSFINDNIFDNNTVLCILLTLDKLPHNHGKLINHIWFIYNVIGGGYNDTIRYNYINRRKFNHKPRVTWKNVKRKNSFRNSTN